MDFEPQYSPNSKASAKRSRNGCGRTCRMTWVKQPIPRTRPTPITWRTGSWDSGSATKAGLWPTAPVEYGGGGLSIDHAIVIEEELDRYNLSLPPYYDSGGRLGGASILVWGTEEQKQRLLPPILRGEVRTWQLLTEPGAGSDLAGVRISAVRDGDEYVINGQKIFVGSSHGAEQFWMIACTDQEGPRHQNLSWFVVPADSAGITVVPMDLLIAGGESGAGSGVKNTVFFDNVRVPGFNLVGGENNGWQVATTHLELEHGSGGTIRSDTLLERLFSQAKSMVREGKPLTEDSDIRDLLVGAFIDSEVSRLFGLRNYWMRHTGQELSYQGPQSSYYRKVSGLRTARAMLQVLGPYALTNDADWDPSDGHMEVFQRSSIVALHPGGTAEIQKVIMARRIGIGRAVREEAGALA